MQAIAVSKQIVVVAPEGQFSQAPDFSREWLTKQLLNEYRDKVCTVKDIKTTFKHIYKAKAQNNDVWRDEYNYLLLTIKRLKQRGCDVRKLERAFNKHEKQLFKD